MLLQVFLIGFLATFGAEGNLVKNAECVAKMEAVQECTSDAYEIMDEALENDDGRKDFEERKYCNYMTTSYENCTDVLRDCFPQEEINFWIDNDLSNYMDGIEEFYGNWDSQKCPPFRKMLERKANDQSTSSECRTAMESFHDCRQKALVEWEESEDDGRPDFSERKRCNFETGWLATCPSKLLDVCKSKDEIERMQFWELFTDKFEYENWDMDKCPAVKEVTSRWNDLKKSFEEDSSEDESDEGVPTCEDLKRQLLSVRTEGCLQYSCSTGSMKVEMLEKCKELINAEVQKIVKKRLEECKEERFLSVQSGGPAGEIQHERMGIFTLLTEKWNGKTLWEQDTGKNKLFYHTVGRWVIGEDPKVDLLGLQTSRIGLSHPPASGWEYTLENGDWIKDPQIKVSETSLPTKMFPDRLEIVSEGGAFQQWPEIFGSYNKTSRWIRLRPVYQKQDDQSKLFFYSEVGYWAVGRDVLVNDCLLSTTRGGLWFPNNEIQWMYDDGNNGWAKDDPTIRINL